jgi:hypothetical protein
MMLDKEHIELLIRIDERTKATDEKVDGINTRLDKQNCRVEKSEQRISVLENWRWYLIGIVTALLIISEIILKLYS